MQNHLSIFIIDIDKKLGITLLAAVSTCTELKYFLGVTNMQLFEIILFMCADDY
jgi:hypothetical protein